MKKTLLIILAEIFYLSCFSQIPNFDFENWTSRKMIVPDGWSSFGKITRITPGTDGNYALRIERDSANIEAPGAIIYGNPDGGSGIPFAARPDSLIINVKYNIAQGDASYVLLFLEKNNKPVSSDTFFITGAHTNAFVRLGYKIKYLSNDTPDSMVIAFTSTNPNNQSGSGYLIIDNIQFTGTNLTIPNCSFETWDTIKIEEPVNWNTSNSMYYSGKNLPITKSNESYSGNTAVKIQNANVSGIIGEGYVLNGVRKGDKILPGFRVTEKNNFLTGFYKYFPQKDDEFAIVVYMYKSGGIIGGGYYSNYQQTNSYKQFVATIYYYVDEVPDSASILMVASSHQPLINSILYVDKLDLNNIYFPGDAGKISGPVSVCQGQKGVKYSVDTIEKTNAYVWTLPAGALGESITNSISVDFTGNAESGSITVKGRNDYSDGMESLLEISVNSCVSVPEQFSHNEIALGPNPVRKLLTVNVNSIVEGNFKIEIYNSLGRLMYSSSGKGLKTFDVDMSNFSAGIYFIKCESKEKIFQQKILKE